MHKKKEPKRKIKIDPLTGRQAVHAVRCLQTTFVPPDGKFRILGGNLVGGITIRLPDALQQTVQSSVIEVETSVRLDGVPLPLKVEIESFAMELEWE